MAHFKRMASLLLAVAMLCLLAACRQPAEQSGQTTRGQNEAKAAAQALTDRAIEEFLRFTEVPRPCYQTDLALRYLADFAEEQGLANYRDEYGNFWMDLPATEGYEDYPGVILQGHMDMVCVSEPDKQIDFIREGITAVVEANTITADGTSLGADNGIAVGIMLALAKSEIGHGPVRCLITTDEDVGLLGAAELPADALNADYLINIDAETLGEIIYSTAGDERAHISALYETAPTGAEQTVYALSVSGLLGGHSGVEIDKNRLSANVLLVQVLQALNREGMEVQLISADCGTASGSISPQGTVEFAVRKDMAQAVTSTVEAVMADYAAQYQNEDIVYALQTPDETGAKAISPEDTARVLDFAAGFPQGVIAMSEKTEGIVATSFNFGLFTVEAGLVELVISFRSCVNEDLERLEAEYKSRAESLGFAYEILAKYPGYDGDPNAPLLRLTQTGFREAGVDASLEAIHAGLECSWFALLRNGIQMVAIGPTIHNAHTVNETLYVDTVLPVVETVLYCLENINTLQ